MRYPLFRVGLRAFLFLGIMWGVTGTFENWFQWLAFMLIAEGAEFVARTAWQWEAEERTAARRRECRRG